MAGFQHKGWRQMPKKDEVQGLGYEEARDQLASISTQLERGNLSLEESLALWEQGEKLAAVCEQWLTNARERISPKDNE